MDRITVLEKEIKELKETIRAYKTLIKYLRSTKNDIFNSLLSSSKNKKEERMTDYDLGYKHGKEAKEDKLYKEIERLKEILKKIKYKSDFNKSDFKNLDNCQNQLLEINKIV